MVGTRVGATRTGVRRVLPEAMCVAIIRAHITDEDGWRGTGNESGGSGERVSWRGRDDGSLMCTVVARGLSRKLSESLLVFKVEVCCKDQQRLVGKWFITPFVDRRSEHTCAFKSRVRRMEVPLVMGSNARQKVWHSRIRNQMFSIGSSGFHWAASKLRLDSKSSWVMTQ